MKEQTAQGRAPGVTAGKTAGLRALGLDRALPAAVQRWLVPLLFIALALLVTASYGSGVQLNDGQASLHINPLRFLGQLLHAWNPALSLGTHTGFWVPYQMPYSWVYGLAQALHVSQDFAQHGAVFLVYLGCLWSMYYCLRGVAPWLDEISKIAGSVAYLFNLYVALNSQAQIVWLLTYGTLPAMVGVLARAMRGEMNVWRASLAIALLALVGAGVNPPLVAINVIIVAIFVVVTIAVDPKPGVVASRTLPIVVAASIAAIAINLYWVVPFVDYFRGVWLNGVLSEAPSMHNAATSFANVLRGLGHWATFVSFAGRAYFPWAATYAGGLFGALLWFVPVVALSGVGLRRNQRPATLFFLLVAIVSIPIVVGYYHDELGDAVTTPVYDQLYRNFPGFQMFRFSYKWVAGVEFGLCGLYALSSFACIATLREYIAKLNPLDQKNWAWTVSAARTLVIALPILVFVPVVVNKTNYPGQPIPSWEYRESSLVGKDQGHRVALFPTQFLEQFDWGNPQFYIEDSLIDRPMVYGLLGSEPSEGSDMWVRRAYRATREGLPFASDLFRVMGVDTILQRDDFIPAIDFSSPGEWRFNTTTLTHDLLHRVLRVTPERSDGPLHVYKLPRALPLLYGVTHPVISTLPTFSDAYLGDVEAMASGKAEFDPPTRSEDEFSSLMQSLAPILPATPEQVRDLALKAALSRGIRVHPPSADAAWLTHFTIEHGGDYAVFALDQSLLFDVPAPQTLEIDGRGLSLQTSGGAWTQYSNIGLTPGTHWVSDGYLDPDLVVALVSVDDLRAWQDRITTLTRSMPQNLASSDLVFAPKTTVTVPASGKYRLRATAVGPFGPDGLINTRLRSTGVTRGAFPADLSGTLPYVFAHGVVATSAVLMPPQWYRDDPSAYDWQRGDPISWFLFARDSTVRVFVPGGRAVHARVSMRVSRLQVSDLLTASVNGGPPQSLTLGGPPAKDQAYDSVDSIDGPVPVPAGFAIDLHPGWNDVAFDFHLKKGEPYDLGPDVISAAVAPDLSFEATGTIGGTAAGSSDASFTAYPLLPPPAGLTGDPDIVGSVSGSGNAGVSLAVALETNGKVVYRLFPIGSDGAFDINFMHPFPNGWDDSSDRIVGMWFLSRTPGAQVTDLFYNLHALPGRALRHPRSLDALPIKIDGRLTAARTVFLTKGRHVVSSGDRQVKIATLALDPVTLPRTRDFTVAWQRRAPTAIDVTVRTTSSPFLLVFGEAFHPEWRATLAGQQLPHVIVDGVSNGWIVPSLPSGGKIELTFTGQTYYVFSAAISIIALLIIIVLACSPDLWPIHGQKR
ncbi:MAG TPA: alpha-(1-_3)-arabinofuranosyltransferase family protein [Candidatus Binatia bacterium]|nr:alpha-(1->3)-arabinofuranosyltransferase family protein [Candidatus Binatia bacterium]